MPKLEENLNLDRCPHCSVNRPLLLKINEAKTTSHAGQNKRSWRMYKCNNCGGVVTAAANDFNQEAKEIYPSPRNIDIDIPERAREYLKQAIDSLHAPAGAVMLAASAVDAMLKEKNYTEGSLYTRINKAAEERLITQDMAKWAHEVRLDANDQRHVDTGAALPTENDAKKVIDFTEALAQFLFVLPKKVQRGIKSATE